MPEQVYMVYDLTVEGFNTAICNKEGYCVLNNVNLNNNRMDYIKDKDDGAAILNGGVVFCSNCAFNNNYAKNGGAIFTQELLSLDNCTFNANHGYGVGDDVLNVDQGIVLLNGQQITGSKGPITYVKSMSSIASKIISALAIVGTVIAGVGSGIAATVATGGNIVFGVGFGVGVGISVGGVLGVGAACAIAPHLYNLAFDRITVAESIVYTCVVAGIFSGFIGGAVVGPFFVKNAPNIGKIPVERELESVVNQELESVADNEAGSVVNKEVESIVNNEVKVQPVEEPSLGEQLEYNSNFWGPIRSRYVPVQKEAPVIENPKIPAIENPEIPAEDLNIVEEKSLEIKNFNKLRMCSREKISKLINSRKAYSFKVDCQECTCKVANDWGEIKDLVFSEGKFLSKFYVRCINTAGEQIDVIFTFDINFDLIRVVELG